MTQTATNLLIYGTFWSIHVFKHKLLNNCLYLPGF